MADIRTKIFSEDNWRYFISVLLGIKSGQDAEISKCIKTYTKGDTYTKDDFVIYLPTGSQYMDFLVCKATHTATTDSPNMSYFNTIDATNFESYDNETLESYLNLSEQELLNLQSLLSEEISTTHTFSSSRIYSELQNILDKSKEYSDKQLEKAVKPAYLEVSSETEMTDAHYIYLLSNGTNFDMYILENGTTPKKIGTSDIDLSAYTTTADLEADYLKKTDATSTYATITTVDSHTTDTDIHTSATEKASYVKKTDIVTTYDSTVTDEQVYSAKAINDIVPTDTHIKEISLLGEQVVDTTKYGDDLLYFPCGVYIFESNAIANNFINAPVNQAGTFYVTSIVPNKDMNTDTYVYRNYRYETYYGVIYTRSLMTGSLSEGIRRDSGWNRVCKTKVVDISKTAIVDDSKFTYDGSGNLNGITYCVYNGWCEVKIAGVTMVGLNETLIKSDFPEPELGFSSAYLMVATDTTIPTKPASLYVKNKGLYINTEESFGAFWGTLVYKVKES